MEPPTHESGAAQNALAADIASLRFQLALIQCAGELKYDRSQPRAPVGTREGGQWTRGGAGSAPAAQRGPAKPGPGAALSQAARMALSNPEAAAVAAVGVAPLGVGAIGVSRAAGLYDHYTTGRGITPFLHIPYDKAPLTLSDPQQGAATQEERRNEHVWKVCSIKLDSDLGRCGQESAKGRTKKEQNQIFEVCRKSAMQRLSECMHEGGLDGIHTPLFTVAHRRRPFNGPTRKRNLSGKKK